jgi:hypothetical protein
MVANTAGTLYFITERDPFGDRSGSDVKIGLVRENDTGRSSLDRLLEHQTGNPRILVVAESLATSAPISVFETSVHQQLASHRVCGERTCTRR